MSFTGSTELNQMGGLGSGWGGGFGSGGFGAFGLIGLLGLDSLGNRRKDDCGGPGVNELATLQAIANAKDTTVAEGRALGAAICESEKTTLNQFYASAIQAANNTQSIKDQNTAFAIVNDKRFDDVTTQIANTTAAILSRINDVENQNLRDQLFETRRRFDAKENELTIVNTNTNINQQLQQQQMQLQLAQLAAETKLTNARALADEGLGIERLSRIEENKALATERLAEAQKDRELGFLHLIEAIKKIQSVDLSQVVKIIELGKILEEKELPRLPEEAQFEPESGSSPEPIR